MLISKGKVNISKLKKFILENFPKDSVILQVLLSEDDELDIHTFLARLPVYLKLRRLKRADARAYLEEEIADRRFWRQNEDGRAATKKI